MDNFNSVGKVCNITQDLGVFELFHKQSGVGGKQQVLQKDLSKLKGW